MENLKTATAYFTLTVGLILLLGVNYFHDYIESIFPGTPGFFIAGSTSVLCIIGGYILYRRERKIDRIKYEFLTVATHKFRTPITAIRWLLDSLKKELSYEERINVVKQVEVSVNRLMEVVDMLTGFTKFESKLEYAFEVTWPRQMIEDSLGKYAPQANEKNITFNVTADNDIPLVIIDKRKMQSAIDILFENAIQYSPKGGRIDISLRKDGNFVLIGVKDEGVGVKKSDIPGLFKRFSRTKQARQADPEGMGLSLSMMKEIVKKHGGKVFVESEGLNKGTTFFIRLKASKEKPV